MADIATPASLNVRAVVHDIRLATPGAALALFTPVYQDTDGTAKPATAAAAATAAVLGVVIVGAGTSDQAVYMTDGKVAFPSAVLTKSLPYYLSHNAGMVCPYADLTTGDVVTQIGYAESTTVFVFNILQTGITVP